MKKFLTLFFALSCATSLFAQPPIEEYPYDFPLSFEAPSLGNEICSENPPGTFFDWRQPNYSFHTDELGQFTWPSPFNANTNNIACNNNVFNFCDPMEKDYHPEDGWVYFYHSFGSNQFPVENPVLVLYNKHSGILRVFILVTKIYDQNNHAFIELTFRDGSNQSALLEPYIKNNSTNTDSTRAIGALDNFDTAVKRPAIYNDFVNIQKYWLHADFATMYDPCACLFDSSIGIYLRLEKEEDLNFTIDGNLQQQLKPANSTGKKPIGTYFEKAGKGLKNIADIHKKDSLVSYFPKGMQYLPKIGAVLGVVDILIGLFKPSKPEKPTPIVFDLDATGNGSVNWSGHYKEVLLSNPGSNQINTSPGVIPAYNNILGVFNLLETPTVNVELYEYIDMINSPNTPYHAFTMNTPDKIKYVVNPRAKISTQDYEIRASYVVKVQDPVTNNVFNFKTPSYPIQCMPDNIITVPYQMDLFDMLYLKIDFFGKTANLKQDVVFTATYKVNLVYTGYNHFTTNPQFPSSIIPICNTPLYPPESADAITALCNSSNYNDRANTSYAFNPGINRVDIDGMKLENGIKGEQQEAYDQNIGAEVFPNPAGNQVHIKLQATIYNATIEIFNNLGQSVKSLVVEELYEGQILPIEIDELHKGIYFIKINDQNNSASTTHKFLKH